MEKFWDMRQRLLPDIIYRNRPNGTFTYKCLCGFEYSGSPIVIEDDWVDEYVRNYVYRHKCMSPTGNKHRPLKGIK